MSLGLRTALGRSLAPLRRGLSGAALPAGKLTTHYKKVDRATDTRWEGIDMERFADVRTRALPPITSLAHS